jgi:hypothetical protein
VKNEFHHLLGVNNSLGLHLLVKSQRFILIRIGKLLRVRCTYPVELVEVRISCPDTQDYQKKKKKKRTNLLFQHEKFLGQITITSIEVWENRNSIIFLLTTIHLLRF